MKPRNDNVISSNKKAYHNYFIEDKMEVGMELFGWEVKSARVGTVNLGESFVYFEQTKSGRVEAFLNNAHFSKYKYTREEEQEERRSRRLLIKRNEIEKFHRAVTTKGVTCIATKLYFNSRGMIKCEIGLARGKQNYDKKQTLKERDINREAERAIKERTTHQN